jgi:hypothetical protein
MKSLLAAALALGCTAQVHAGGCPQKFRPDTFVDLAVPDGALRPADANAFNVVDDDMSIERLFASVGPPDASDGTTMTIYVYCLKDGSEVRVATRDGTTIDYVRHGRQDIYKRKKKK